MATLGKKTNDGNKIIHWYQRLQPYTIYIPFSPLNVLWHNINKKSRTVLDVCCGRGEPMSSINLRGKFYKVGVDIYELDINKCKTQALHDEYVICDVLSMPFKNKSFDTVMCLSAIEHFDKDEAKNLLRSFEQIARKQVIIMAPVGEWRHRDIDNDPNPFQRHRSVWSPAEFKSLGYKVRGSELQKIFDEKGLYAHIPKIFKPLHVLIWLIVGPFVYFLPGLAGQQICSKNLDDQK